MIYCRKCSRFLDEESEKCPYCGNSEQGIEITEGFQTNQQSVDAPIDDGEQTSDGTMEVLPSEQVSDDALKTIRGLSEARDFQEYAVTSTETPLSTEFIVGMTLLSVFISPAGIVAGITLMTKEEEKKKFGLMVFILSLVMLVLGVICCCCFGSELVR